MAVATQGRRIEYEKSSPPPPKKPSRGAHFPRVPRPPLKPVHHQHSSTQTSTVTHAGHPIACPRSTYSIAHLQVVDVVHGQNGGSNVVHDEHVDVVALVDSYAVHSQVPWKQRIALQLHSVLPAPQTPK